jgi:uncharacterized protein (DUF302 family)
MTATYGITTTLNVSYDEAVARATEALKTEGFGVLTEIDVKATLKKKLDKDFRRYVILGACNPPLAYQALSSELEIGLLLPCNVIVYENDEGGVVVSAMDPAAVMGPVVQNPAMAPVAEQVTAKLQRVINSLSE